ncbi:MAG: XRE family transcriptional regulator [Burkholderiales bacterium]|nr:MAG: XRE family transcriptional regulator [Burkholderiales bacterium]
MHDLHARIRLARNKVRLSQSALAAQVGVQRSAVAQWEAKSGTSPSMEHLAAVAVATGVSIEWLGTGRGAAIPNGGAWEKPEGGVEYAQDGAEAACLTEMRRLPSAVRKQMCAMISTLSRNC